MSVHSYRAAYVWGERICAWIRGCEAEQRDLPRTVPMPPPERTSFRLSSANLLGIC